MVITKSVMTTRLVRMTGLEPARQRQRNLNPPSLPIPPHPHILSCLFDRPVAVPDKILGLTLFLDFIDRGHSLPSLHLPPAALGSLPNSTTSALLVFYHVEIFLSMRNVDTAFCAVVFLDFVLTLSTCGGTIYSVWCTLR